MAQERGRRARPQQMRQRQSRPPVKKKKQKNSGMFKFAISLAVFVFACYTVFSMVSLQAELVQVRSQLSERKTAIEQKSAENENLKKLIKSGSEKDLIERMAREKLGYVYAGEEIFQNTEGK